MYKNIAITKVVLVTSMNYNTTEKDLRNFFASCGKITNIRFLYDKSQVSTGSAYVAFDSHEAALKAYAKDDTCLRDRFLRVALNRTDAIEEIMTKEQANTDSKHQEENTQSEIPDQKADEKDTNKETKNDVEKNSKNQKLESKQKKSKKESKDQHRHHHKHHKHHKHHRHHRKEEDESSSSSEGVRYYSELPE